MKSHNHDLVILGLETALKRLSAFDRTDRNSLWIGISEVLNWLYQCEEAERNFDEFYYQHRNASPAGCTLGGLVWLRGQIVHRQADAQEQAWVIARVFSLKYGEFLPIEVLACQDGSWKPINLYRLALKWPSRLSLPDKQKDKYGRDVYYETYIQGQDLLQPLEQAARYLFTR